ncbi:hypothetical protein O0I10_002829 [Lichtheimia ornata]|uniref:Uncharacterized protein n=1 Tax=Lichtheimia ornata TaxID=688661 RepID=A0AAD7VAR7_9FUNG|nr:uncharacterized protein O0I10_002829 [Lichtheimia ornata]KAJ8661561.1 hypothetical protein O0I10_002829 [Lichtheimia ornata]
MDPYQAFSALASVVVNEYRTSQAMWFLWMANLQAANSQQEEIDGCMSMDQSEMYAVLKMPRFIGKRSFPTETSTRKTARRYPSAGVKHVDGIKWDWGDVAQDILKEEAHTLLKDGAPRLKGQMPNGFFKMKYHGLIMALIEISDPPNTKDHIRFVGDKIKLAKNLKHLLKKVREKLKRKGDHELYQCIKVYIRHQVYNHKLYLYSLRQPTHGIYVFQEEFHFDLSCEVGFFSYFLPRCLRKLSKVQMLLNESSQRISRPGLHGQHVRGLSSSRGCRIPRCCIKQEIKARFKKIPT